MNPLEGLTSAIGDEVTRLGGFRATRLQQPTVVSSPVAYGVETASVDAADATKINIVVNQTIPTLVFRRDLGEPTRQTTAQEMSIPASVVGAEFRVVDDASSFPLTFAPTASVGILVRNSATQITLASTAFEGLKLGSWEIFEAAQKQSFQVETTHGWADDGVFAMDGALFSYTTKGANHFHNVEYFNGEIWTYAIPEVYPTLTELVDYTQVYSGADTMRRSFLVDYAAGEDLSVLGRNLNVDRPDVLPDDTKFRQLIKAIAYTPLGTMWAIEMMLDAMLGPGNYEIFEDLTRADKEIITSPPLTPTPTAIETNFPAQIFIKGVANPTQSAGKTFIESRECVRADRINPAPAPETGRFTTALEPITMYGAYLAPEGPDEYNMVLAGTPTSHSVPGAPNGALTATYSAATDTMTIEGAVGVFPTVGGCDLPLPGDRFDLLQGSHPVTIGYVKRRVSDQEIEIAFREGLRQGRRRRDSATGDMEWRDLPWQIIRTQTEMRYARPSEDCRDECRDGTHRQIWYYDGDAADPEGTKTTLANDVTNGAHLEMGDGALVTRVEYYAPARVIPETEQSSFGLFCKALATQDIPDKLRFHLADGSREIAVGFGLNGADRYGGILDAVGNIIAGTQFDTPLAEDWHFYEIQKSQEDTVALLIDGHTVATVEYGLLPLSGAHERRITVQDTTGQLLLKSAHWASETYIDFVNLRPKGPPLNNVKTVAPNQISNNLATDPFTGAVAGDLLRITTARSPVTQTQRTGESPWPPLANAPFGEWEVVSHTAGPPNITVVRGPIEYGTATVTPDRPEEVYVRRYLDQLEESQRPVGNVFTYPYDVGREFKFESGENNGVTGTIAAIINPMTGAAVTGSNISAFTFTSNRVRLAAISAASGTLAPTIDADWRISDPQFGAFGPLDLEITDRVTLVAGTTYELPEPLPISITEYPNELGPLLEVRYTRVLSAQVLDDTAVNAARVGTPAYEYFPFYLNGGAGPGWLQGLMDVITAAGVHVDLFRFFRDTAGPHIV